MQGPIKAVAVEAEGQHFTSAAAAVSFARNSPLHALAHQDTQALRGLTFKHWSYEESRITLLLDGESPLLLSMQSIDGIVRWTSSNDTAGFRPAEAGNCSIVFMHAGKEGAVIPWNRADLLNRLVGKEMRGISSNGKDLFFSISDESPVWVSTLAKAGTMERFLDFTEAQ